MVQILDSTLREGEQTSGVYFDSHIKLAIAKLLDEVGIDIIEAGHPMVSAEIHDAVKQIANSNLKAIIGAHSRSMECDVDLALECGVKFLGTFYCVSEERLNGVFKRDIQSAIQQITKVIRYAKDKNPNLIIRYTPEDTVRSSFENVVKASKAALLAGADIISIADTTGFMIPGIRSMYDYVSKLKKELSDFAPKIAVHCHNDRGLALANVIDAYRAGADIIDATVLGLGERAGIVDLAQLLTILKSDFNENKWDLKKLNELYELVSMHSRTPIPENYPIMGKNAFTHCAGVHTHAATINPLHYQSLDPDIIGREMKISLGHMSGLSSVNYALKKIGENVDNEMALKILEKVKLVGTKGKTVDLNELKHIVKWCRNGNSK